MSFAVHLFMTEKFSEESYRQFLGRAQNLFGKWAVEETVAINDDPRYLTIHECWIKSRNVPDEDRFRINVEANKHLKDVFMWHYDYEWHLSLETSTGRSWLGLGVQLGVWLLAMRSLPFNLAVDRDSSLKNEPTEFWTMEAAAEHIKRCCEEDPPELAAELKRRGILSKSGFLLLPKDS